MAAGIYCSGPVDIFVGIGPGAGGAISGGAGAAIRTPQFLGHGEEAPTPEEIAYWRPVKTDLSGGQSGPPHTKMFLGSDVRVSVPLIRYDWTVLQRLRARPNPFAGGAPGAHYFGDRGSLMIEEGLTFQAWFRWPYSAKAAMAGMPNGMHLLYADFEGPDRFSLGIDKPLVANIIFYGISGFAPAALNNNNLPMFQSYDGDMTALAGLPMS